MNTSDLVEQVRNLLNRPEDDDLFEYPDEYYSALTQAYRHFVRKVAQVYPELIYERATVSSLDSGETYVLSDDHLGEIQVWAPPGPPRGLLLLPTVPYGGGDYWIEGKTIRMTSNTYYSAGLTVLWIPATIAQLSEDSHPNLPEYFFDAMAAQAAAYMARKPGITLDPDTFFYRARNEWSGDARDASDQGILGTLRRQNAMQSRVTTDMSVRPWWRGIGG